MPSSNSPALSFVSRLSFAVTPLITSRVQLFIQQVKNSTRTPQVSVLLAGPSSKHPLAA